MSEPDENGDDLKGESQEHIAATIAAGADRGIEEAAREGLDPLTDQQLEEMRNTRAMERTQEAMEKIQQILDAYGMTLDIQPASIILRPKG